MGGFGSAQGMITSLKNNSRRNKREAYDGWTTSDKESQGVKVVPVSEKALEEIRNKIQRQNQKTTIKSRILIIVSIIITIWITYKVISGVHL